jgi:hypothetical protein
LAVEAEFPGFIHPFLPAAAEILVEKWDGLTFPDALTNLFDPVMLLITAVEQGGSEGLASFIPGPPGRGLQPDCITGPTPFLPPGPGLIQERFQIITLIKNNLEVDWSGIFLQCLPSFLIFPKGMDIGIIEITQNFHPLFPQGFQGENGTGSAADVEKDFHESLRKCGLRINKINKIILKLVKK